MNRPLVLLLTVGAAVAILLAARSGYAPDSAEAATPSRAEGTRPEDAPGDSGPLAAVEADAEESRRAPVDGEDALEGDEDSIPPATLAGTFVAPTAFGVPESVDGFAWRDDDELPSGDAVVETYTVVFGKEGPSKAIVIGRQGADNARFLSISKDPAMLAQMIDAVLDEAGMSLADGDAIAATAGPGLIGGGVSGVMCAKGIAAATGKPLYGINHLAGHALTPRLTDNLPYTYLMLLVSGGHCQFLLVKGPDTFQRIGGTIDDAPGEAFDKVARLIGLVFAGR